MAAAADELTLPYAWYSDEDVLKRERRRIFARTWQYGGRAAQVAEPGAFLTADAGGVPILVVRDKDGELRAFLNVCRHRGAVLMDGCGTRADASVPLPRVDVRPRRLAAHGSARGPRARLRQRRLVTRCRPRSTRWGPFLFVNPDPTAAPLAEHLGELPEILARDIDVNDIVFHSRVEFGANANWKIVVENFLECYHCPTAHPCFSAEVDVHPDRYLLEAHPTFGAQFARREGDRRARPVSPPLSEHRHQRLPGAGRTSRSGRCSRAARAGTERYLDYFFAPGRRRGLDPRFLRVRRTRSVARTPSLVESVHRGMASGVVEQGRLLLNAEPLLAAFQRWVAARI